MTKAEIKILKNIVGQGYKLKAQHNNPEWRKALEDAELLLIDEKNKARKWREKLGLTNQPR